MREVFYGKTVLFVMQCLFKAAAYLWGSMGSGHPMVSYYIIDKICIHVNFFFCSAERNHDTGHHPIMKNS